MSGASRIRTATLWRELMKSTRVRNRAIALRSRRSARQQFPLQRLQSRSPERVRLHSRQHTRQQIEAAKCVLGSIDNLFHRLLQPVRDDRFEHDDQHKGRCYSPRRPHYGSRNRQCRQEQRQPRNPQRLHLVRRFRPLQQLVGMHSDANIFAKHREVFPKIELIAQFAHCGLAFANLVRPAQATAAIAPAFLRPCGCATSTKIGISCPCRTDRDLRSIRDEDRRSARQFLRCPPSDLQRARALVRRAPQPARPVHDREELASARPRCRRRQRPARPATRPIDNAIRNAAHARITTAIASSSRTLPRRMWIFSKCARLALRRIAPALNVFFRRKHWLKM